MGDLRRRLKFVHERQDLFLEDLEQYSLMHFKRKPDVQLGNLEEYMVKLYEQDKLIRKKQRLFLNCLKRSFSRCLHSMVLRAPRSSNTTASMKKATATTQA